MEYRAATATETEIVQTLAWNLRAGVMAMCPNESAYPGVTGLVVEALMLVAGELLQGLPDEAKAGVVAHYQEHLAMIAGAAGAGVRH